MDFEFLIPKRPISSGAKSRKNLQLWKKFVYNEAAKTWTEPPYKSVTAIIQKVQKVGCVFIKQSKKLVKSV